MRTAIITVLLIFTMAPAAFAQVPDVGPDLWLPELGEASEAGDVQVETARRMNPVLKVLPIALVTPLAVAGVSIAYSSPIAYGEGDWYAYGVMRTAGLSIMGGAYAAGITLNALVRTGRMFGGGEWTQELGFFIGGIGLATGGLVVTTVATLPAVLDVTPAAIGLSVTGGVLWGVGMMMLIVDAAKSAFDSEALFATHWRPGRVQLAGLWATPSDHGASAGLTLRW